MRRVALVVSLLALGVGGPVGDVKKGDTMSFTWCPDAGVEVAARGTVRGTCARRALRPHAVHDLVRSRTLRRDPRGHLDQLRPLCVVGTVFTE